MKKSIYLSVCGEALSRFAKVMGLFIVLAFFWGCNTFAQIIKEPEKVEEFPQATSSDDPIYYDFIAKYFYNREDFEQAIYFYEILNEKYSLNKNEKINEISWTTYEIGFCYLKLKKLNLAERKFVEVVDLGAGSAVVKLAEARIQEIDLLKKSSRR